MIVFKFLHGIIIYFFLSFPFFHKKLIRLDNYQQVLKNDNNDNNDNYNNQHKIIIIIILIKITT